LLAARHQTVPSSRERGIIVVFCRLFGTSGAGSFIWHILPSPGGNLKPAIDNFL